MVYKRKTNYRGERKEQSTRRTFWTTFGYMFFEAWSCITMS